MKSIAFVSLLFISSLSYALNANSSWEDIYRAKYQYKIDRSTSVIYIDDVPVSIFNLCKHQGSLHTIKPVTICADLRFPRQNKARNPLLEQKDCQEVTVDLSTEDDSSTEFNVDVLYAKSSRAGDIAFTKKYSLTDCPL